MRAGTTIRCARREAVVALVCSPPASAPAARVRLNAMTAHCNQAALAATIPTLSGVLRCLSTTCMRWRESVTAGDEDEAERAMRVHRNAYATYLERAELLDEPLIPDFTWIADRLVRG